MDVLQTFPAFLVALCPFSVLLVSMKKVYEKLLSAPRGFRHAPYPKWYMVRSTKATMSISDNWDFQAHTGLELLVLLNMTLNF